MKLFFASLMEVIYFVAAIALIVVGFEQHDSIRPLYFITAALCCTAARYWSQQS